ncbi:hypothetical protein M3226_14800 [Neobacillus cucumis]|uniref:hypothetical protein n=1 Tax=Neobacillus cucumis TaxID=1740721 RepID=UPI0020426552|nr:hypothetical protein [Neobacillus cucumis]MCM3726953.1 hypothetical protein [Neobacillus cucumis]
MNNPTIIALGDHSALDEQKAIILNVVLDKQNLIIINANENLINWQAYCKSCDGSAYIYLKDPEEVDTFKAVRNLLNLLVRNRTSELRHSLPEKKQQQEEQPLPVPL